jgi:hypothetical protein
MDRFVADRIQSISNIAPLTFADIEQSPAGGSRARTA